MQASSSLVRREMRVATGDRRSPSSDVRLRIEQIARLTGLEFA